MDHARVLVADRNSSFLKKTGEILSAVDVRMVSVQNGARVLARCRHEQPDLALLHTDLPSMPGTEVCQRIKTQVDPALPVALMFSEESPRAQEIADQCNADNFLVRPLKRTELLYCVRSLLQLRKLLKSQQASASLEGAAERPRSGMVGLDTVTTFLELELRRVDRYGFPLAVAHVGLDPLPEDAGQWSKVLDAQLGPALADAIRSCVRDIDISAMLSNREMLVVMPHTDREGARLVARRICKQVSSQSYHFGRARIQPTTSIGVATLHGERMPADELVKRARANRDRAADAGGNRIVAS